MEGEGIEDRRREELERERRVESEEERDWMKRTEMRKDGREGTKRKAI